MHPVPIARRTAHIYIKHIPITMNYAHTNIRQPEDILESKATTRLIFFFLGRLLSRGHKSPEGQRGRK